MPLLTELKTLYRDGVAIDMAVLADLGGAPDTDPANPKWSGALPMPVLRTPRGDQA